MTFWSTPLSYWVNHWTSSWSWSSVMASAGSERPATEESKWGETWRAAWGGDREEQNIYGDCLLVICPLLEEKDDIGSWIWPAWCFLWESNVSVRSTIAVCWFNSSSSELKDAVLSPGPSCPLLHPVRFRMFECSQPLFTPAVWHNVNPVLDHRVHFASLQTSQRLLDYLQSSAVVLELWGLQGED